jgi:cell division protein FtsZ
VKTIMSGMGVAMMGTGMAEGEGRAMQAAQRAVSSPLLEDSSVHGARGVIINVTGGPDLSLSEVSEASCVIQEAAHEDANIIFGAVVDPQLTGRVKLTVIATGFDRDVARAAASETPVDLNIYTAHLNQEGEAARAASALRPRPVATVAEPASTPLAGLHMPASPALGVTRRPGVELSMLSPGAGSAPVSAGDNPGEVSSPLDVPAFLRRQS